MDVQRAPKKLAKFFDYVLSRRPDEFGLVLDADGFVKIKEFLKAIGEEDGFRYVRRAHLNEIMLSVPDHSFEISDNLIRSITREHLPQHRCAMEPPKLLYTCVRQKAYPHVHEKGIRPAGHPRVILSSSRGMAERIGKRLDHSAVTLTIQTQASVDQGVVFFSSRRKYVSGRFYTGAVLYGSPVAERPATVKKTGCVRGRPGRQTGRRLPYRYE